MKTMNDFNSAGDKHDDLLVDCLIYLLGKKIYHRVVEAAGRLRPAFLAGLSLTKDRSIIYCIEC